MLRLFPAPGNSRRDTFEGTALAPVYVRGGTGPAGTVAHAVADGLLRLDLLEAEDIRGCQVWYARLVGDCRIDFVIDDFAFDEGDPGGSPEAACVLVQYFYEGGRDVLAAGVRYDGEDTEAFASWMEPTDGLWDDPTEDASAAAPATPIHGRIERAGADVTVELRTDDGTLVLSHTFEGLPEARMSPCLHLRGSLPGASFVEFSEFEVTTGRRIDEASNVVFGCHLRSELRLRGLGLEDATGATLVTRRPYWLAAVQNALPTVGDGADEGDGAATSVTTDGEELVIVLPLVHTPGEHRVLVEFDDGEVISWDLDHSDAGYRLRRSLLPPGRYPADPADPFNVILAVNGQADDRIARAMLDAVEREIAPETCQQTIDEWERKFGISPAAGDDLAARRARVSAADTARPGITVGHVTDVVRRYLPGRTIAENEGFDDFGALVWQYQVYESESGELSAARHAQLESDLAAAGPAYTRGRVGAQGFTVGTSPVGRDFV